MTDEEEVQMIHAKSVKMTGQTSGDSLLLPRTSGARQLAALYGDVVV